jgi:flavin-dependent dehydrogenase
MSAPNTYDVVVVGGRVAGASTAMLLARAGAKVALVDRGTYGSDTQSTHGLMRAGVLQLSRWGVLDEVIAAGTPAIRRTLFHYAGEDTVTVSIRPTPHVNALYAPRRHLLDRILVDAAAEAGVHVHHGSRVVDLLRDGGRDLAGPVGPVGPCTACGRRVAGIRVRGNDGRALDLRGRITVGADGIRSVIAAGTRADVIRQGRSASAFLYRYFADLPTTGYEWAYGGRAAAGLIPTNSGLTCVFVSTTRQRMRELRRAGSDAAFAALLQTAGPELQPRVEAARTAGSYHGWTGVPGFVRRSHGAGWALVGDAGYFKDPITTHGMTDAMRDAELLASALLDTLAGGVPERRAMAAYQRTRDALSAQLFETTEAVAAYEWDTSQIQTLLRRVSSAMSDEVDHLQALPDRLGVGVARCAATPRADRAADTAQARQ